MLRSANKTKYRIQGKIYYKEGDVPVTPDMYGIISEIWDMRNPKGDNFKLLIRYGKTNYFSLYDARNRCVLKTYSISKIEDKQ